MMEHPPCEIIQQQSQRYSHQSIGGAEQMVQTIEKNSGITIKADSPLLTWLQRQHHTRRFDTRLTKTQSCSLERQLRADDQEHWSTNWNPHGSKAFGSDVTAKQMSI